MVSQPSPEEAADALRTVDRSRKQAVTTWQGGARWVDAVFGVALLLYSASVDFFPQGAPWRALLMAALVITYVVLLRTRRGSAILGQSARLRRDDISPKFTLFAGLTLGVVMVGSLAAVLLLERTGTHLDVPYLSTGLGAVMAVVLIAFGPQLRTGMNRLARKGSAGDDHR
jgi:steroid 5-alpha reductase family enzyme